MNHKDEKDIMTPTIYDACKSKSDDCMHFKKLNERIQVWRGGYQSIPEDKDEEVVILGVAARGIQEEIEDGDILQEIQTKETFPTAST